MKNTKINQNKNIIFHIGKKAIHVKKKPRQPGKKGTLDEVFDFAQKISKENLFNHSA